MGDPSGFFGGVLSGVPGTDAYTLENKYYQQIRGAEARRAIEEMKKSKLVLMLVFVLNAYILTFYILTLYEL